MRSRKLSPGSRRDADDDPVGEDSRAAGDGGAVAARLADHRRRLARDRRLVDARDALDHLAVGRDDLAGRDDDRVADAQRRARHVLERAVGPPLVRDRLRARLAELVGLRLAAALRDGLGEVGEEHREPEPRGDEPREDARVGDGERGDEHAADLDDEQDRVAGHAPRVELEHAVPGGAPQDRAVEQRARLVPQRHRLRCSRSGPRASIGRYVGATTMRITPTSRPAKRGFRSGRCPPSRARAACARATRRARGRARSAGTGRRASPGRASCCTSRCFR